MPTLRSAADRGHADHGWLRSAHTFSFAGYHDPAQMGFGPLRVINEDRVRPGAGFATHGHADMEIISVVLDGVLAHRDSMGNGSEIRPGEVQLMSAGTGVRHSEFNHQKDAEVHFLQIWIQPAVRGTAPRYAQAALPLDARPGQWRLLLSPDGAEGSLVIGQDARLYGALLHSGGALTAPNTVGRRSYLHVMRGSGALEGGAAPQPLVAGDGVKIEEAGAWTLTAGAEGLELLRFDLP
ncbi:MAG: pirin family protein [Deltaproteobacteria bacterium]|nr:pirin family protein [Deltaproteobacteria bacterium]